jgi:hypothetical protein
MNFRKNIFPILVGFIGGCIAYYFAMLWTFSGILDGEYIPVGHDSFYHARRFLDFIAEPSSFYQYDTKIHAPEGSWLTWPWAYTVIIGYLTIFLSFLFDIDPVFFLWRTPPAFVFVNAALFICVCKKLELSNSRLLIAMCCFAFSPLTQGLHGFGVLDHHYIEYTFVLASLCCGLHWFDNLENKRRAILLAAILGIAPAFHNSLFILQVPFLLSIFIIWCRAGILVQRSMVFFSISLLLFSLIAVLPSEPFRDGQFSFYTLSWFHLFISICTALLVLYINYFKFSKRNFFLLIFVLVFMGLVVLSQIYQGLRFFEGDIGILKQFGEIQGGVAFIRAFGWRGTVAFYSYLFFLIPLSLVALYYLYVNDKQLKNIYFIVFSLFGIFLLWQQFRLHYYGSFALYLPLLIASDILSKKQPSRTKPIVLTTIFLFLLSYQPVFSQLFKFYPLGLERDYEATHDIYPQFKQLCNVDPGVVLALPSDGHYIRFHTSCSIIANNFLISHQHEEKVRLVLNLLVLPLSKIQESYPWIKYVYVHYDPAYDGKGREHQDLLQVRNKLSTNISIVFEKRATMDNGHDVLLARIYKLN